METFLSTGWYHIHLRKFSRYPNSSPYGEQSWKGRIILVDWFAKIVARFVSREKEKIGEFYFARNKSCLLRFRENRSKWKKGERGFNAGFLSFDTKKKKKEKKMVG